MCFPQTISFSTVKIMQSIEGYPGIKEGGYNVHSEVADEQYGFVGEKDATNGILILPTIIEKALKLQKEYKKKSNLCFVDYTKALDRVL